MADPIYGWSPREGVMFAISGGYFLYDLIISLFLVKSQGVSFLVHAGACCFIFFKVSRSGWVGGACEGRVALRLGRRLTECLLGLGAGVHSAAEWVFGAVPGGECSFRSRGCEWMLSRDADIDSPRSPLVRSGSSAPCKHS